MRIRASLSAGNGRAPKGNRGLASAQLRKLRSWGRGLSTTLTLRKLRRKATAAVFVPELSSQLPELPAAKQKDRLSPSGPHPLRSTPLENQVCRRAKQRNRSSCVATHRPYPRACNDRKQLARFPPVHAEPGHRVLIQFLAAPEIHAPSPSPSHILRVRLHDRTLPRPHGKRLH